MRPGGVNAPPSPQPDPATSALLRRAHRRLGMSKPAQPRPPSAEVRCSKARVGSGSPACVGLGAACAGLGAAVWAEMVPGCLPPQTSLCWAGRARSCGGRAPRAVSTGTGCLTCTSHAEASLLFAFLPLSLLQLSPSPSVAASRLCCLACRHSCIPGASPGLGALAPLAASSAGSPAGV